MPRTPTPTFTLVERALHLAQIERQLHDPRGVLRRLPVVRAALELLRYEALLELHHAEVPVMRRVLALRRQLATDSTPSRQRAWRKELAEAERQLDAVRALAPPLATLGSAHGPAAGEPPTLRGTVERRRAQTGPLEVRAAGEGGDIRFSGYAAIFNSPTWIGAPGVESGFQEELHPGAFARTIRTADVRLLLNHDPNVVLARTKSGTLQLAEDQTGLKVDAALAPTQAGRDLAVLLERGDVSQMSFGFRVVPNGDTWEEFTGSDGNTYQRRVIREVELFDVSVVTYPAYEDTTAALAAAKLVMDRRLLQQAA